MKYPASMPKDTIKKLADAYLKITSARTSSSLLHKTIYAAERYNKLALLHVLHLAYASSIPFSQFRQMIKM